jgi:hypothetical protein
VSEKGKGISRRKLIANRRNAQSATGPTSEAGKARSSRNRLLHGLTAKTGLLVGEDRQIFEEFKETLRESLDPWTPLEEVCVEGIILCAWKLSHRLPRMESEIRAILDLKRIADEHLQEYRQDKDLENEQAGLASLSDGGLVALSFGPGYETVGAEDELMERIAGGKEVCWELRQLGSTRGGKKTSAQDLSAAEKKFKLVVVEAARRVASKDKNRFGREFIWDIQSGANYLEKFSRYERETQNSFLKLIHELQRLQASRRGQPVAPAIAVDVTLSGEGERS